MSKLYYSITLIKYIHNQAEGFYCQFGLSTSVHKHAIRAVIDHGRRTDRDFSSFLTEFIYQSIHILDPRAHLRRNLRFRPPENSWRLYEPDFDFLDEFFGRLLTPNSLLSEP